MNTSVNKSWPKQLDKVIDEHNKMPHDITGFPPCFLMYGNTSYPYILNNPLPSLEEARKQALENTLKYHKKNKIIYDKKHIPIDFHIGEEIMMKTLWQPNNGKMTPVMFGPFKIIEKMSPVTFKIDRQVEKDKYQIVHVSKLRKYFPPA